MSNAPTGMDQAAPAPPTPSGPTAAPNGGRAITPCACMNLRQASRAVTQVFDDALRPCGLRATQLGLLIAAKRLTAVPVTRLAEMLVMDRSTLARNLKPLEKRRLVTVAEGEDRRVRTVSLTTTGEQLLEEALPLWESAQNRLVTSIGPERFDRLLADLGVAIDAAQT